MDYFLERFIKGLNLNAWLKSKNKKTKNDFENDSFKLMNNAVFWITMKNVRKPRDIKLLTTERRKYYLVSEPHFHATKFFTGSLLALEIKKTEILMNKLSS